MHARRAWYRMIDSLIMNIQSSRLFFVHKCRLKLPFRCSIMQPLSLLFGFSQSTLSISPREVYGPRRWNIIVRQIVEKLSIPRVVTRELELANDLKDMWHDYSTQIEHEIHERRCLFRRFIDTHSKLGSRSNIIILFSFYTMWPLCWFW